MEAIAKAVVVAMAVAALLWIAYVGARTARDPIWFIQWHTRLNGDPRDYPSERRKQLWARWNLMLYDPDSVRSSPFLQWQLRAFGISLAAISAVLLAALIVHV